MLLIHLDDHKKVEFSFHLSNNQCLIFIVENVSRQLTFSCFYVLRNIFDHFGHDLITLKYENLLLITNFFLFIFCFVICHLYMTYRFYGMFYFYFILFGHLYQ
jgi:hypothetical protein